MWANVWIFVCIFEHFIPTLRQDILSIYLEMKREKRKRYCVRLSEKEHIDNQEIKEKIHIEGLLHTLIFVFMHAADHSREYVYWQRKIFLVFYFVRSSATFTYSIRRRRMYASHSTAIHEQEGKIYRMHNIICNFASR